MSSLRRDRDAGGGGFGAGWLTTFNDLMTLMLVFFVMIFAMSSKDTQRMLRFQQALHDGLGVLEGHRGSAERQGPERSPSQTRPSGTADAVNAETLMALAAAAGITAARTAGGEVQLTLENRVLFAFGHADILPEGLVTLDRVGSLLARVPVVVQIEGHTDNVPIRSIRYPSNWELSTARAVNVLKVLAERGHVPPRRLAAVGYGDARPLLPNDTSEHRAMNRRVQLIVAIEKG